MISKISDHHNQLALVQTTKIVLLNSCFETWSHIFVICDDYFVIGQLSRVELKSVGQLVLIMCVCLLHLPGLPGCSPISGELSMVIIGYMSSNNSIIFVLFSVIIFSFSSSSVKYLVYSKCFASSLVILHSLSTCFCVSSSSWHRRHILSWYLCP